MLNAEENVTMRGLTPNTDAGDKPALTRIWSGSRYIWVADEQPGGSGSASCDPDVDIEANQEVSCSKFGSGWKKVGAYHSHPQNTGFSNPDKEVVKNTKLPLSKITPDKKIEILEPNVPSPRVIRPSPIK